MTTTHLLTDLTWENCADQLFCDVEHHLPNTTLADAQTLTPDLIIAMFNLDNKLATETLPNGHQFWLDPAGDYHRDYGLPAIIYTNGRKQWYQHGIQHRIHGPALIDFDSRQEWWLNGMIYSQEEHQQRVRELLT